MAYASVEDIEARMGRELDDSEKTIVTVRLNDVELLILSRIPDLHTKVVQGKISPDLVAMIEADAVMRILKNPDGVVGETDGNYSYTLNWSTVSGRLSLLPEEWRMLGVGRSIFTVQASLPVPWCQPCGTPGGDGGSGSQYEDGQAVWWGDS